MTAIELLERCRAAPARIRRTEQQIWQRGRIGAGTEELEARLRELRERSAVEQAAACVLLDGLRASESAVIYGYYVTGLTAAGLARKLHYSDSYVRRLRKQGLARLAEIPEEIILEQLPRWYRQQALPEEE